MAHLRQVGQVGSNSGRGDLFREARPQIHFTPCQIYVDARGSFLFPHPLRFLRDDNGQRQQTSNLSLPLPRVMHSYRSTSLTVSLSYRQTGRGLIADDENRLGS